MSLCLWLWRTKAFLLPAALWFGGKEDITQWTPALKDWLREWAITQHIALSPLSTFMQCRLQLSETKARDISNSMSSHNCYLLSPFQVLTRRSHSCTYTDLLLFRMMTQVMSKRDSVCLQYLCKFFQMSHFTSSPFPAAAAAASRLGKGAAGQGRQKRRKGMISMRHFQDLG